VAHKEGSSGAILDEIDGGEGDMGELE